MATAIQDTPIGTIEAMRLSKGYTPEELSSLTGFPARVIIAFERHPETVPFVYKQREQELIQRLEALPWAALSMRVLMGDLDAYFQTIETRYTGNDVRNARRARKLSVNEMADLLNIPSNTLIAWEACAGNDLPRGSAATFRKSIKKLDGDLAASLPAELLADAIEESGMSITELARISGVSVRIVRKWLAFGVPAGEVDLYERTLKFHLMY